MASCSSGSGSFKYSWTKYDMDGHRTGVLPTTADNVREALGELNDTCYFAPNGNTFPVGSSTYAAARDMIEVQPEIAPLKEVVGYAAREMIRRGPNCELSNWIIDHLMDDVEKICKRKVDVGIINSGGIRVDLPAGDIIKDDLVSMLPFKNYLCYVALKGSDLTALFEDMASRKGIQPFGGAKLVVNGKEIESLTVGGQPIDPDKVYGVATIDFLLDGGDKINVAKNCVDLVITDVKVIDSILPYVASLTAAGKPIEAQVDDRLIRRTESEK